MSKRSQRTLTLPPFPPLALIHHGWEGTVRLRSWEGFQAREGGYGFLTSDDSSDGTVQLSVAPPNRDVMLRDPAGYQPPSPEQARAFQHLLDNETAVRDAVLQAIFAEYPKLREELGEWEEMPEIKRPEDLKNLIGLSWVHISGKPPGCLIAVGFEFGCTWDVEHGLGVLTHEGRVVEVGQAETGSSGYCGDKADEPEDGD